MEIKPKSNDYVYTMHLDDALLALSKPLKFPAGILPFAAIFCPLKPPLVHLKNTTAAILV